MRIHCYQRKTTNYPGRYSTTLGTAMPTTITGRILDAGCSYGYETLALARKNPIANVIGIDRSKDAIKYAQDLLRTSEPTGLRQRTSFLVQDFYDMTHAPLGTFEAIFCANNWLFAYPHMHDSEKKAVALSLFNSLQHDGKLFLLLNDAYLIMTKQSEQGRFALLREKSLKNESIRDLEVLLTDTDFRQFNLKQQELSLT